MSDRFTALRKSQLLRDFTDVGVRILAEASKPRSVGRGTYVFRGGEPSMGILFIVRGSIHLLPRDGNQPLGEVSIGDSLGGLSLLLGGEHLVSAFAATDVELLVLEKTAFEALKKQKPGAATKLELALSRDLIERMQEAKAPLREFLSWQASRRA